MIVCHPYITGNSVSGLEVLDPGAQASIPSVFGKIEVQRTGRMHLFDKARHHDIAMLIELLHFCLDLLP